MDDLEFHPIIPVDDLSMMKFWIFLVLDMRQNNYSLIDAYELPPASGSWLRQMTLAEKHLLWRLIEKPPSQNFDGVIEIAHGVIQISNVASSVEDVRVRYVQGWKREAELKEKKLRVKQKFKVADDQSVLLFMKFKRFGKAGKIMLAEKYKIEQDQTNTLTSYVALLLQQQDEKLQLQQRDSPIESLQVTYVYRWIDGVTLKKQIVVSAPEYVDYLMEWVGT
ncbi:kinesin like protein for actin based chloroplast movement 2 [Artemisia annua]|uniref:Kinesin like protein for actin based chloroplast movement 2 n=1 Tax=Artemisia annua TaxID=35608 RepID=A0A2U1MB47_ARTAN|nr:kinesin like protein for actin based chloroplast movement 2 [Artemisia annua]